MPTNPNMVAIQTVTVGAGGAATISFTSIPQTYTDLYLLISVRTTYSTWLDLNLSFNGNASSGYSYRRLQSDGGTPTSNNSTSTGGIPGNTLGTDSTANTFSSHSIYIPNYTSTTNKSVSYDSVTENNATTAFMSLVAGASTLSTAITSITLGLGAGNIAQYSTATLYGVTSAQGLATGGFVTSDANYYYHTFTASGTFTPLKALSCDILVVAGGGSGGWPYSGGGGAGGVIAFASQALTATGYTVTVGGGAAGAYNTGNGVQGSNSVFGSLTAAVGGGGGVGDSTVTTARNGGSGGGGHPYGRGNPSTDNAGGTATSGQGNAGGLGSPNGSSQDSGGGGGGAGAVGANATSTAAGAGGAGTNSVTNWGALSSVLTATGLGVSGFIAGGGGGGTNGSNAGAGGSGGGGRGARNDGTQESEAGAANTGSGSGGGAAGNAPASPKNGGSGLVIVRYAK